MYIHTYIIIRLIIIYDRLLTESSVTIKQKQQK